MLGNRWEADGNNEPSIQGRRARGERVYYISSGVVKEAVPSKSTYSITDQQVRTIPCLHASAPYSAGSFGGCFAYFSPMLVFFFFFSVMHERPLLFFFSFFFF